MKRLLAALIFFTRLPFWRLCDVPAEHFKRVVPLWPLTGWLTGALTAAVLWIAAQAMPLATAWLLAIAARVLMTGALHEDGLADFCDGLGGGTTRERILAIMKDSHIGTYGVIGLVLYFLLLMQAAHLHDLSLLLPMVVVADTWSKMCAAHLIRLLPYCRKAEEAKIHVTYERATPKEWLCCIAAGLLPALLLLPAGYWPALVAPAVVLGLLVLLLKRRIGGYTGDCCGAAFLLCELAFYLTCLVIYHQTC